MEGKVYLTPHLSWAVYFIPNYETVYFTPEHFKTGQITPGRFSDGGLAIVTIVLSFPFLLISTESLKNYSKSQKNHKIENLILLDSI
jgi:hypothetical protein